MSVRMGNQVSAWIANFTVVSHTEASNLQNGVIKLGTRISTKALLLFEQEA